VTLSRRQAADLLEQAGLAPKRSLGQNFVVDPNTVRRIARLARVGPGDHVVEIGAGLGSLTLALAETGATVVAVEVDDGLVEVLRDQIAELGSVSVVHADAMTLDWPTVLAGDRPWVLVANLPYNVGTPLIADLLDQVPQVRRMLVMVQREVADRLVATPRSGAYGALSVKVASWARSQIVGDVPASVFLPRPNVASALVAIERVEPAPIPADVDRTQLFELVKAGFAQRRKMLRRSLAPFADSKQLVAAGIRPEARAEELDVHDWVRLWRVLHGGVAPA
jgi:16S rRNA (adenine1518-N6/adenine1519-N6)-dimethyltransferase